MNARYYNIPSLGPISKREAYTRAVLRFGVERESARQDHAGICWQGQHGAEQYAEWSDLPSAKR
jgi:hypothetical protein